MAFMVPLVKNNYDIYRANPPDTSDLYLSSASMDGRRRKKIVVPASNGTSVPVVIRTKGSSKNNSNSINSKRIVNSSISLPNGGSGSTPTTPTKTRPFPHIRRTVRNPITNRVYSYSVSIPDYVAEEDEEQLERELESELELAEEREAARQVLIFSTSAPAGTGPIGNGIVDMVDEDDLIRYTGARLPPTLSRSRGLSDPNANLNSKDNSNTESNYPNCPGSNSREYIELLRKFILHLKMLKLKRIFRNNENSNSRRSRKNTLNDSNQL